MKRYPGFFQHVEFYTDRFHASNHRSCSLGYTLHLSPRLAWVNSEVCEQFNAFLQRMAASLRHKGLKTYKHTLAFAMALRNLDCAQKEGGKEVVGARRSLAAGGAVGHDGRRGRKVGELRVKWKHSFA